MVDDASVCFGILNALNPVFCLVVNVFFQVLIFRLGASFSLLKSIVFGFLMGFIVLLAIQGGLNYLMPATPKDRELVVTIVTNALIYFSLGYCYFHFLNLGETARRIRILRELSESKDGLTMKDILSRYNSKDMVTARLGRLLNSGQISLVQNRYIIESSLLLMSARVIAFLKLVIIGKRLGDG